MFVKYLNTSLLGLLNNAQIRTCYSRQRNSFCRMHCLYWNMFWNITMELSYLTLFFRLCVLSQLRLTGGLEQFIRRRWNRCAAPGTHYSLRSGLTFQQCVTECVNRLECHTLSYRIQEHVCMFLPPDKQERLVTNTNANGRCISVKRWWIVNAPMVAAVSQFNYLF